MILNPLVPGRIWHAQRALKLGPLSFTSRMTVVKLENGALWVHAPVAPTEELIGALSSIGPVGFVVAPNKSHHLFFKPFLQAFPSARGFIAPGLAEKRPDLTGFPTLAGNHALWEPELESAFIDGLPILNETVWFHKPTATLILTDLLLCFGRHNTGLNRVIARLLGVYDQLAMSRTMKALTKNKSALLRSVEPLLAMNVQRIILAHDQIIEHDAGLKLEHAFQWLRR